MPHHLKRLQLSLDGIRLANPHTEAQWDALVRELDRAKQPFDDQARLPAGDARRGEARPRVPAGRRADGVHDEQPAVDCRRASRSSTASRCVTAEDNRWLRCDIKTTSLLGNVLMRQLAVDARRGRDDHVPRRLPDRGSASNVLIVKGGK